MALEVGINVIEVDGRSSPAIAAAPTSVAAFIGLSERGLPDQPVRISNLQQFRARFGAHLANGYMAHAIDGFFLNGGVTAYISRIVGPGSTAATITLDDRQAAAAPTLQVTAGYRGLADPGDWGERLRLDVFDNPRGVTTLQASTIASATSAQLTSLSGLQVGSVVHFTDGGTSEYRKITGIDPPTRTVQWDAGSPITPVLNQASTQVTTVEFAIVVHYQ